MVIIIDDWWFIVFNANCNNILDFSLYRGGQFY